MTFRHTRSYVTVMLQKHDGGHDWVRNNVNKEMSLPEFDSSRDINMNVIFFLYGLGQISDFSSAVILYFASGVKSLILFLNVVNPSEFPSVFFTQ